jgi:hypothetical protein
VWGAVVASGDEGGFQALSVDSKGAVVVFRRPGLGERVGEGEGESKPDEKVLSFFGLRCNFKRFCDFLRSGKWGEGRFLVDSVDMIDVCDDVVSGASLDAAS